MPPPVYSGRAAFDLSFSNALPRRRLSQQTRAPAYSGHRCHGTLAPRRLFKEHDALDGAAKGVVAVVATVLLALALFYSAAHPPSRSACVRAALGPLGFALLDYSRAVAIAVSCALQLEYRNSWGLWRTTAVTLAPVLHLWLCHFAISQVECRLCASDPGACLASSGLPGLPLPVLASLCVVTGANRGNKAHVIQCDEFGFMKDSLFFRAVLPLFQMDEAALLCITTPASNPLSQYSELLSMTKNDGTCAFKHFEYTFVCPKCIQNKYDQSNGQEMTLKCPHKTHRLPPWQSQRKHAIIQSVMKNRQDDLMRETMGIITSGTNTVFARPKVDAWYALPLYANHERAVKHIFVCIDPNTGHFDSRNKPGSDFAMVSGYETPDAFVICGMEAIDATDPSDYLGSVVAHLRKLRNSRVTHDSTLVMIIENNLGMESGHLHHHILASGLQNIVFLQHKELKVGVFTEHWVKRDMVVCLRKQLERPSLRFAENFVCVGRVAGSSLPPGSPGSVAVVKEILKKQALGYCEIKDPPKTPHGKVVTHWTGKTGVGVKDDLIVALQLCLYWKDTLFYGDAKYAAFR